MVDASDQLAAPVPVLGRWARAQFDAGLSSSRLSRTALRFSDMVSNSVAATSTDLAGILERYLERLGFGGRSTMPSTFLPRVAVGSVALDAFVNGSLAHCLDFDDTHSPSIMHASSSVLAAGLAAGVAADSTDTQVLTAGEVGTEIALRIALAGYDRTEGRSLWLARGFHSTAVCGAMGSAVVAGLLFGLDDEEIGHALAISTSMASGLLEANHSGGTVKRVHTGWAAHSGVSAALLALAGLTGPATALDGPFGLLQAYVGRGARATSTLKELGARWYSDDIGFKLYPSNVFTHALVDMAMEFSEQGHRVEDIVEIVVELPEPTLRSVAEPQTTKRAPRSGYEAKFSAHYVLARALLSRGAGIGLQDFMDEVVTAPDVLALTERIEVRAGKGVSLAFPAQFGASMEVVLRPGSRARIAVDAARGSRARPASRDELAQKFRANLAAAGIATDRANAIWDVVATAPTGGPVRAVAESVRSVVSDAGG